MPADPQSPTGLAIAIVGIGGVFAGSDSPDRLWARVLGGDVAIRDVPPGRWLVDPIDALDPAIARPDRVYTTRGGFVDPVRFDPAGTGLDPALCGRLDPAVHLALVAADQAWRDARTESVDRGRVGVILGHIVLPTDTAAALALSEPGAEFEPLSAMPAGLPASMIARAFGLGGVAYTLDAACASSLYALKLAVDELRSGRADAMIAGGVSRPDALYTQMGFSQLRALSPRGEASPLDHRADGLIVGEGAGMFVLKRLEDALRHGDRVRGVIAGIGLSNDVGGDLMAPDSEGQLRALRSAYAQAGWRPSDVDLIECHATGTPRGDAVELASLRALRGDDGRCVIGSIKSTIGHSLTAAGAAGLLEVLMALEHRIVPPTSGFERANPQLALENGPFRVLTEPEPWPAREPSRPRRAAVSAFGFGGINAHLLVEEATASPRIAESRAEDGPIAVVGLAAQIGTRTGRDALDWLIFGDDRPEDDRIRTLELPVGRFRIPPKELAEMLPQQSLMLRVAAEAIEDASWDERLAPRTGVFVGIGLDLNTTNFYLRWSMVNRAREWDREQGLNLPADQLASWTEALREAAGPSLSANRTMGSLGGVVASRIARAFRIGGPSFTVSCDETSGIQALAIAVDGLRRGELDSAIVGAVDFAADDRLVMARRRLGSPETTGQDAAVGLVLKRLEDARRDGDPIRAVIREVTTGGDGPAEIGRAGATTGLTEVVRMVVALNDRIETAAGQAPRPYLKERADILRRSRVVATNHGGRPASVVLEEGPSSARLATAGRLRQSGLFALEAEDAAFRALGDRIREHPGESIDAIARRCWREQPANPRSPRRVAIVADGVEGLARLLEIARRTTSDYRGPEGTIFRHQEGRAPGVALVYPGLGSYFPGMGRELGLLWPEVLRKQEAGSRSLREQMAPEIWWGRGPLPAFDDHRAPILAQVAIGSLVTDVLLDLGIAPDAAIGYSMGESAALVALRAWTGRDELADRLRSSPLFAEQLSGPCHAARRAWGIPADRPVDWVAGVVPRSAEDVHAAIADRGEGRVYALIRNTAEETVIGGDRAAVLRVIDRLRTAWVELPAVSTVHCEIGRLVEAEYEALHDIETDAPPGIAFYSGVSGHRYAVDRRSAARAIAAQASRPIDFAGTIANAHADGIGLFIEVGPGGSCTRMIDRILAGRPHAAVSACRPDREAFAAVLDVLAAAIAHGLPVDLAKLYGQQEERTANAAMATIRVDVGPPEFRVPPPPVCPAPIAPPVQPATNGATMTPLATLDPGSLVAAMHDAERARSEAHRAFLRLAQNAADLAGRHLAFQLELLGSGAEPDAAPAVPALYDRAQCLELAVGSVASVFGPGFEEVDRFPTRVRLPDEPLMLVDRITELDGTPRSLESGRIVTEHDILPGAWYLDGDRVAPCVAMEAGQADLVLSGYLGVDFVTQGRCLYRLLDANVTFHRELPVVGEVMRYDIRITKFFRQGTTVLFRFEYDATVDGEPLITMRDGCAGFFTPEELAAGKGVGPSGLAQRMRPSAPATPQPELIPAAPARLDEAAVEALRSGDLAGAFGSPFDELDLEDPPILPGGLMAMIRRVTDLDPTGGPSGLGFVRAEADVRPGDWYMTCHFIDDRVMPGTLMYECCLHTLRILLMRLGWVGPRGRVAFEPVPGVANRLKCRGQITEATRVVAYEITIKGRGYRPEPYAIADALIVADGKPIVSVTDLALQLSGTDRDELERLWRTTARAGRSVR